MAKARAKRAAKPPVNTGEPINPMADAVDGAVGAASTEDVAPKEPKRRRKQPELPGVEGPGVAPVSVPEIEDASDAYVAVRDKRQALTKTEVELKGKLLKSMKDHGLENYRYVAAEDDIIREVKVVKASESVKVAKASVEDVAVGDDETEDA